MQKEMESFSKFLELIRSHVYSEPDTELHTKVIDFMVPKIINEFFAESGKMLDVGCGSGYTLELFKAAGFDDLTGLTLSDEDVAATKARGFDAVKQDMSFTDFSDAEFDYLWVRHALEHSAFPLLTLIEFHRLLKTGGKAYIEMPSSQCTRLLEDYDNHYSIMGPRQWTCLMKRAGFEVKETGEVRFKVFNKEDPTWEGEEVYEWYVLIKK